MTQIDTFLTGGTGLIGRWLVIELTRSGRHVGVLIRGSNARRDEYLQWLTERGADPARVQLMTGDLSLADLGMSPEDLLATERARDYFHAGAAMVFPMDPELAHRINVVGTQQVMELAARSPRLRRFVYVSGFKLADQEVFTKEGIDAAGDYDSALFVPLYRRLGSYEASKMEAEILVRSFARQNALPTTIVQPGGVMGDSQTGETTQGLGLPALARAIWEGSLPALPGGRRHWIPMVTVDHVARFMAGIVTLEDTILSSYLLLDDTTPTLAETADLLARHYGVSAPKRQIPLPIVKTLLKTGLLPTDSNPEELGFITTSRYDVSASNQAARDMGITMPSVRAAIAVCADYLAARYFDTRPTSSTSATSQGRPTGGMRQIAGAPAYVQQREHASTVLLHGLPLDAGSWSSLTSILGEQVLTPDLPGIGRSPTPDKDRRAWMESLLASSGKDLVLVGHSLGSAYAVEFAAAHPERVSALVLISPFFLQAPPPYLLRNRFTGAMLAALMRRKHLEALVGQPTGESSEVLDGPYLALSRKSARGRFASALARAHADRQRLQGLLETIQVPTSIIVGKTDPLRETTRHPVQTIADCGHYPQLNYPDRVAAIVAELRDSRRALSEVA